MRHREAIELLDDLLAGTLRGDRREALEEHVDGCVDCRAWMADYRLLAAACGDAEAEHPSSEELARHAAGAELLPAERERIGEHLRACEPCRELVTLTSAAVAAARREPRVGRLLAWKRAAPRSLVPRLVMAAGLILALAVGLTVRGTLPEETNAGRVLLSGQLRESQVVEASESITATAVTIESGTEVVLRAGEAVVLENGFVVSSGASLKVETGLGPHGPAPNGV